MSIFSFKKEKEVSKPREKKVVSDIISEKKVRTKKATKAVVVHDKIAVSKNVSFQKEILLRPIITEKAHLLSNTNTFAFEVAKGVNKNEIKQAVYVIYGFKPLRVAIIKAKSRRIFSRGKKGQTRSFNKAYITLKNGDKINLV